MHHLCIGYISIIADTCLLSESPSNLAGFIFFNSAISLSFDNIDPFSVNNLSSFRNIRFIDFGEYSILF